MAIFFALFIGMSIFSAIIPLTETCVAPPPPSEPRTTVPPIKEAQIGSKNYISLTKFIKLAKAIFKIQLNQQQGTAFLCYLPIRNGQLKLPGLMTNMHVISYDDLKKGVVNLNIEQDLGGTTTARKKSVILKSDISRWFSGGDDDLDATFFQLKNEAMQQLTEGTEPLEISTEPLRYRQGITVLQHPKGGELSISNGQIVNDTEVYHDATTDGGSSGSPLLDFETLKVVAIHTGRGGEGNNYNTALSMASVVKAIENDFSAGNKLGCNVPNVENGRLTRQEDGSSVEKQLENGKVILTCNAGYVPQSTTGTVKTCSSSGELLPELPSFQCDPLQDCVSTPEVENGYITEGLSNVGANRTIQCNESYENKDPSKIFCQSDKSWTTPGECVLKVCDIPFIDNGYFNDGSSVVGSTRRIVCNQGHILVADNDTIVCQQSGAWDFPNATCEFTDYEAWFLAVDEGNEDELRSLIQRGADVNVKNDTWNNWTALHYTARKGYVKLVQLILDKKPKVDEKDRFGQTPLIWACINGSKDIARLLIENGADINLKDNENLTPLIFATSYGRVAIVRLLVDNPQLTTINHKDKWGRTALMLAKEKAKQSTKDRATYNQIAECLSSRDAAT